MARGDSTDEQWAVLEPLLPRGRKPGRLRMWSRRQLIDGIRFRVRTGIPWRDVPAEYGPRGRIHDLFRRWQRDGTWHRIHPLHHPGQGRSLGGLAGPGTHICRVVVTLPQALGFARAGETPLAPRGLPPPPRSCTHHGDNSRSTAGRSLIQPDPNERPQLVGAVKNSR
ncbi:transposase [Streptomyces sp. NPDC005571]|uniref:transposase n=1 Tax=unclassified Streptomyces TaxID=2593676 RepID=UPI0033A39F69